MANNPKWIKFNFNPWGARAPDCAIRAISAATGLDYREVCRRLKAAWKSGFGLVRKTGVGLSTIEKKFAEYCDIIEDFYDNYNFVPDEFKGTLYQQQLDNFDLKHGINAISKMTLNDFIDYFDGQGTFLVSLEKNPNAKNPAARYGGHIVCVKCHKGHKQGFIDIWDSGEMYVDAYMRIKRQEPIDSPNHWRYDRENHKFIV